MTQQGETTETPGNDSVKTLAEMEALVAARDSELAKISGKVGELESELAQAQQRLSATQEGLKNAVSSYRAMVVRANPAVPQDLITGENIEEIDLSLKSARELVSRVKKNIEAEITATRVPAGAPPRSSQLVSSLTPREKIQQGIEKVKS